MAQTYTLEEAAQRLSMPVEEFKRRLRTEWTSVRSFRDGPTLRFRAADIDELARMLGEASDAGLQLDTGGTPLDDSSSDESSVLSLDDQPTAPVKPPSSKKKKAVEEPLLLDSGTDEETIFTVPSGDSGVGKKIKPASGSDSDVRLDLTTSAADPHDHQLTEEIELDLDPPARGSGVLKSPSSVRLTGQGSAKLKAPSSVRLSPPSSPRIGGPASAKIPGPSAGGEEGSSEFELTLDSDSDSFELNLTEGDSSEEVLLGEETSDDRGGQSGINLGKPSDSGVSLEKKSSKSKPPVQDDSDIDFELTMDMPGGSAKRLVGPKSARNVVNSDSEFELTLDDNSGVTDALVEEYADEQSKGDIFETDFELPAVSDDDSGSEVISVESSDTDLENSDFDIAIDAGDAPIDDESASQVVLMDDEPAEVLSDDDAAVVDAVEEDEEAPQARKSGKAKRRPAVATDDEEGGVAVAEDEEEESGNWASATKKGAAAEDDEEPVRGGYMAPPRWGPLPAILLLPCLVIVLVGGMMAFEMIRGQVGYTQPNKPSDVLVRGMAKQFGFKTGD